MISATQLLSQLENRGFRFSFLKGALAHTSGDFFTEGESALLKTLESEIGLILSARGAAQFSSADIKATLPLPSQTQSEWWAWRHASPIQLCDEKLSIVKHIRGASSEDIKAALKQLIEHHSALRSSLHKGTPRPGLTLNSANDFPIEVEELNLQDRAHVEKEIEAFTKTYIGVGDLWLMKAKLFILSESEAWLVLVLHHAIVDGPSVGLIQADLDRSLADKPEAEKKSNDAHLQLIDYATAERAWFEGEAGKCLIPYWQHWLKKQGKLYSPSEVLLAWQPGFNVTRTFGVSPKVMDRVQNLSMKLKTVPFLFLMTVYAISLSKWSSRTHFAIRCIASLRGTHARASIVGNLVTADPVEVFVGPEDDFLATLKFISAEYIGATQIRIPSLLRFPAHADHPGVEDTWLSGECAATMNFLSSSHRRPQKNMPEDNVFEDAEWPPAITRGELEQWSVPLWPIILRLYDLGSEVRGAFQFNESLITSLEQDQLMAIFFDTLKSSVTGLSA